MENDFGPHLKRILNEMCDRVGFIHDNNWDYFKQNDWFRQYSWSREEEIAFTQWLTNYFLNSTEARKELTTVHYKNKKHCKQAAESFVWNYGWITTQD